MNRRDTARIARAMNAAWGSSFHGQTAASAWYFCIDALADALAECCHDFDRTAFLAACREPDAPPRSDA